MSKRNIVDELEVGNKKKSRYLTENRSHRGLCDDLERANKEIDLLFFKNQELLKATSCLEQENLKLKEEVLRKSGSI